MAIKRKRVRKEADTLLDLSQAKEKASNFFERNQKTILGIAGAVVVVVGGWFIYSNLIKHPREEKAMAQMWKAQQQFEQDSFLMALESPGGGYLGFIDLTKEYGNTKAGNLANYYAGVSYLNLGSFDAALSYLNDYDADGDMGTALKHGALGDTYAELNQPDKALTHYKKAAESIDNEVLTPYYMKKLGMFYEFRGEPVKALDVYKKIKSKYPNSNEALSIDKYIARAEGGQ